MAHRDPAEEALEGVDDAITLGETIMQIEDLDGGQVLCVRTVSDGLYIIEYEGAW
jgi:hypothetical protein